MKKKICIFILAGLIAGLGCFSNALATGAEDLTYMTEEYPPFNFTEQGEVKGIAVELLKAIWDEMGVPTQEIKVYPWARAYEYAQTKPGTVLFSTTRNPARENLFKWVGPIKSNPIGVIARKDRNIKVGSFEDLKKYKIGTIREDFSETVLVDNGIDLNKLDRTSNLTLNIKKMDKGRIDLVVNNTEGTFQAIEAIGLNPDDYESVWTISDLPLNYAFHKDTPQSQIDKFQQALNNVEKRRKELLQKYSK